MLRYLFNILFVLFFYEGSTLYKNSWIEVDKESNAYQFHKKNAKSVFDIKNQLLSSTKDYTNNAKSVFDIKNQLLSSTEDYTNTAYIGISIVQEEATFTFPICEKVIFSAHTIDSYPSDVKDVIAIPDLVQTRQFNPMKKICTPERRFPTIIKLLSILNKNGYKYNRTINLILTNSPSNISSESDSIRLKDNKKVDDNLKNFLHCEQIILLHILNNTSLFQEVLETNRKTIPDGGKIQKITLDIITYNDMCPRCFATCECFFNELKTNILANLFHGYDFDDIPFQIIVSSLQPYKIAGTDKFTRSSNNPHELHTVFDAKPSNYIKNAEGEIIQFVNPWLMELYFGNVFEKLQISVNEAKSLEDLDVLLNKIEALKNANIDHDVKSKYDFQGLYNNFCKKYLGLFKNYLDEVISNINFGPQISSYNRELLEASGGMLQQTLNEIQNRSNHQQDEKEFEHNNNTDTKN